MVASGTGFPIEEGFRQLSMAEVARIPRRPEFQDPLLAGLQQIPLSRLIDQELDQFYNPSGGPVELITRVFRRFARR